MKQLNDNWLTSGSVDFELKKYTMLAYLQEVKKAFQKIELYPSLSDLVRHFQNLKRIQDNKDYLKDNFPESLESINLKDLKLKYKKIFNDDEVMAAIEEIIEFAYPKLKEALNEGKEIYEFVEDNCIISPVGVLPLYANEGYFFVISEKSATVRIHQYQITIIEQLHEKLRGIHSTQVESVQKGLGETYESIKLNLLRKRSVLPNPATFLFHSKLNVPDEPTLIPIARRMVVRYVMHHT